MRLLIGSVLLLALAPGCPGPEAADLSSAGEAVVRQLVEQNFGAYETSPWEVVCLRLREEFQVEDEAGFLRRFDEAGDPGAARMPPVVQADRCDASEDERGSQWRLTGTGETAFVIELRDAERAGAERLRIEAGASGGPIDFSLYECTLERREGAWEVEECHAFMMTRRKLPDPAFQVPPVQLLALPPNDPPGVLEVPRVWSMSWVRPDSPCSSTACPPMTMKGMSPPVSATVRRAVIPVPENHMHADSQNVGGAVPAMGNHLVDLSGHEFHGSTFDRTGMFGAYEGGVIFWEAMVIRDFLLGGPDTCEGFAGREGSAPAMVRGEIGVAESAGPVWPLSRSEAPVSACFRYGPGSTARVGARS